MSDTTGPTAKPLVPPTWGAFLRDHPPDSPSVTVAGAVTVRAASSAGGALYAELETPVLVLHCSSEACGGTRYFDCKEKSGFADGGVRYHLIRYACRNCSNRKVYAVALVVRSMKTEKPPVEAVKLGEWPSFGERVPDRAVDLFGPEGSADRTLFFQGRKAENRGLGIGALTYYRRVVSNQKERIIGEIISAAEALNAAPEMIAALNRASSSWRFEDAVEQVKDAIPESLRIDGHNPLVILHGALSEGIHDLSDQQCLERAHDIRVVMSALALRIEAALADRKELRGAVGRLLSPAKKAAPPEQNDQPTKS